MNVQRARTAQGRRPGGSPTGATRVPETPGPRARGPRPEAPPGRRPPLPMQVGCRPLQVPSAWQVLLDDPTRRKGALHWKVTSDRYVKLLPLRWPSAGVPGSPQNTAADDTRKPGAECPRRPPGGALALRPLGLRRDLDQSVAAGQAPGQCGFMCARHVLRCGHEPHEARSSPGPGAPRRAVSPTTLPCLIPRR